VRPFEYHAPQSLDEAIALLRDHGEDARPIAGGTDIVVQMKEGRTKFAYPQTVVSLTRVPELRGIEFSESDGLRLGAATSMAEIAQSPVIRERYLALAEGAGVVGSLQTMNMGTVGGNVCNAAPSADTAPALLTFEAEAVIVGPTGRRSMPIAEFFRGPAGQHRVIVRATHTAEADGYRCRRRRRRAHPERQHHPERPGRARRRVPHTNPRTAGRSGARRPARNG
jgi:carbon-monoxide dehydrogenase medium subunit